MSEAPAHLSYSSRDTWQRCPKAYQLSRIIKGRKTICTKNVGQSNKRCACLEFKER